MRKLAIEGRENLNPGWRVPGINWRVPELSPWPDESVAGSGDEA